MAAEAGMTDTRELAVELGQRVRAARRARGYTQAGLAEEAGVSRDAVVRLEHGTGESRPSTVSKVAKALDLDYYDLLPGPRPPERMEAVAAPPAGDAAGPGTWEPEDVEAQLEMARRVAREEGISEDEALGRLYRQYLLFSRTRARRRRFGLARGERPVMSGPEASTEALSASVGP